jgi:hypothetical protein
MALGSCSTIFNVPVLIDTIDKESNGCAGIVNQALLNPQNACIRK